MNDLDKRVNDIYLKVQNLVQLQMTLAAENQSLSTKNKQLTKLLDENDLKIRQLEEKNKMTRIAQSLTNGPKQSSQDLKLKINELVREVDKCMAMLNS
jgi:hypothetical protein